jgi:hypothetical protein
MLRLAGLKLGVVQAMSVMRTLQIGDRPTSWRKPSLRRRRTLTQLNRGEDRHKLVRAVFHGKRPPPDPTRMMSRDFRPLVFSHINLLGRYAFAVPEAVSRGRTSAVAQSSGRQWARFELTMSARRVWNTQQ